MEGGGSTPLEEGAGLMGKPWLRVERPVLVRQQRAG
eukprot:CAMPEP_0171636150 /NCGR_PEP_ID=MMETSP0990-20121206/27199_1 /TAXON_ID=483369 /ORGANISM="non described non described, Strain CCMP2098" /LENGTH=35 /DNA_ID= /DNA_START= /DNA_END= /DNA_ORIENTATION=